METQETLAYLLIFVFGVVFFIILQNQIGALDTSGWTFTGAEFLIVFIPLVPWLFLAACIIVPVFWMLKK